MNFQKVVRILSLPLLYYVDKSGNSVFRNFCWFSSTANVFKINIPKQNVGKALEYRFKLDKFMKSVYILTPVVLYFIFIHCKFNIFLLLFFELLWLGFVNMARLACSAQFSQYLNKNFGSYELDDFTPPITISKRNEYYSVFKSRAIATVIFIALLFFPMFVMKFSIKHNLTSKKPNYARAVRTANMYFSLYPKSEKIYDMRAFGLYMEKEYAKSLSDYESVIKISGHRFKPADFSRFANLLLLKKKEANPQMAIELFDKYLNKKTMSILDKSKMLWIRSIFKIENHISDDIIQDYENLLSSLSNKDIKNQFYISGDLAYMLFLMDEFSLSVNNYNNVINFANDNQDIFQKELPRLYAERGWAKRKLGDVDGANSDFIRSGIPMDKLQEYCPFYPSQKFVVEKF